jgi:hypothetical protein
MKRQTEALNPSLYPKVQVKPQPVKPKANIIAECSITTDSVVATATLRTTGTTMRRIVVQWGDGSVNTLRHRPGIEAAIGQQSQLPPGTYKLRHAYQAPEDRKPFDQNVLIRVEDSSGGVDYCIKTITLTPRYRVTRYHTFVALEATGDSAFESEAEFDINLFVDEEAVTTWRWIANQTLYPQWAVLTGSIVSRELTIEDSPVNLKLEFVEEDPVFDDVISDSGILSAGGESGKVSRIAEESGALHFPCKIHVSYDQEVTLLVPLPSFGQAVVFKE